MGNVDSCFNDKNIRTDDKVKSLPGFIKSKMSIRSTETGSKLTAKQLHHNFEEDLTESMNEYSFLKVTSKSHNHSISYLDMEVEELSPIEDNCSE